MFANKLKINYILPAILFFTFLTYLPVLRAPFISLDDNVTLTANTSIRGLTWENIKTIFTSLINKTYVPLTILSFAVEYKIFGLNPFGYHLTNLLFHLAITGLVFRLGRRLNPSTAATTAATILFAIHPMHVEPVAWISSRKDLLYSLFYLLALDQHITFRQNSPRNFGSTILNRHYQRIIFFGLISMLAKPMALSLPLILLLYDWFAMKKLTRAHFLEKIPFLLFIIPVALISFMANTRPHALHLAEGLLIFMWTGTFYIQHFFWPQPLTPFYVLPQPVSLMNPAYHQAIFIAGASLSVFMLRRRDRLLLFGFLFYALSTFFLWRFHNDPDITMPVADRFMYLPSVGLCLWLGVIAANCFAQKNSALRKFSIGTAILLAVFLAQQSFSYSRTWQNEITLWSHAIKAIPTAFYPYRQRAQVFLVQKKYAQAIADFNTAVELKPAFAPAYFNRATAYRAMEKLDLALADYTRAIEIDPTYPDPYNNRAIVYDLSGNKQQALADFNKFIELAPDQIEAYFNRGKLLLSMKQFADALNDFNIFLSKRPNDHNGYYFRGLAYRGNGDKTKAREDFQNALNLKPNFKAAQKALATLSQNPQTKKEPGG